MMPDRKRPVTVEDLLRLKRAERPAAEFWAQFDRELRAKQLAALVEKRPWWQRLPALLPAWRRPLLTLGGASAALVVAFVSVREDPRPSVTLSSVVEVPAVAVGAPAGRAEPAVAVEPERSLPSVPYEPAPSPAAAVAPMESRVAELPAPVEPVPVVAEPVASPSARSIAANLAAAQTLEVGSLGRGLGRPSESRPPVRTVASVEPLAQMAAPAEVRRARYRSALATSWVETSVRTDERMARSLSDERMNDGIRRFNAKADRLSVKF